MRMLTLTLLLAACAGGEVDKVPGDSAALADTEAELAPGGLSGTHSLAEADAIFTGEVESDVAGKAVALVGDTDGDGRADLLVGATDQASAGTSAGAAYLARGGGLGVQSLAEADASLLGEAEHDSAGWYVGGAGDTDGDGLADVVVAALGNDSGARQGGAIYLTLGPLSGDVGLGDADAALRGTTALEYVCSIPRSSGDLDGDGLGDLLAGSLGNHGSDEGAGAVYVITSPISGEHAPSEFPALLGEAALDAAGAAIAFAGDVDGDGLGDILVGADDVDDAEGAGRAYLALGPVSVDTSLADADATWEGVLAGDRTGYALDAVGDTDGDGLPDLMIGAWKAADGGGSVYLVSGTDRGVKSLADAPARIDGAGSVGFSLSRAGDIDLDGLDDALVGVPYDAEAAFSAGAAWLFRGPMAGALDKDDAALVLTGEDAHDLAGFAVSGGGDTNADGLPDLLVGAIGNARGGLNAGAAFLVLGGGL